MNSEVMPSIVRMEPEVLKSLLAEVKETVATSFEMQPAPKATFTSANMWNIRKNVKSASAMLRRFN
ncbi:MAG: hypothetical protein EOO09_18560 [Chitinophagaceae bacterium]|nr:MAG: hypothetical protein EOO09_18560 [Chitinophagaceae bacterium]